MQFQVTTAPTTEPITLAEAKLHLRVDGTDEDALITALIQAAREYCENYCNRAILTQTVTLKMQSFPSSTEGIGGIDLRFGKVQSITEIKYFDTDNVEQTINAADYSLLNMFESYIVAPVYNTCFPTTRGDFANITVTYLAGWATVAEVPQVIKLAMLLFIGSSYENREDAKQMAVNASQRLLNPLKLWHL